MTLRTDIQNKVSMHAADQSEARHFPRFSHRASLEIRIIIDDDCVLEALDVTSLTSPAGTLFTCCCSHSASTYEIVSGLHRLEIQSSKNLFCWHAKADLSGTRESK